MSELSPATTQVNRIIQHGVEDEAIKLLTTLPKLSLQEIANHLNLVLGLDEDAPDRITKRVVDNFQLKNVEARRDILVIDREQKRRAMVDGPEFDMLRILKDTAARLAFMMDCYEKEAQENGTIPDAKSYKALTSELRETLKQIEAIHTKIYDVEAVRTFLDDVVATLKDVSPVALAEFVNRMKSKRDSEHIVSEILKGGVGL